MLVATIAFDFSTKALLALCRPFARGADHAGERVGATHVRGRRLARSVSTPDFRCRHAQSIEHVGPVGFSRGRMASHIMNPRRTRAITGKANPSHDQRQRYSDQRGAAPHGNRTGAFHAVASTLIA